MRLANTILAVGIVVLGTSCDFVSKEGNIKGEKEVSPLINEDTSEQKSGQTVYMTSIAEAPLDSIEVKKFLLNFYKEYLRSCDELNVKGSRQIRVTLMKNYCTRQFVERISSEERYLDFDPFLNAQDCTGESINSLEVVCSDTLANQYTVSYVFPPDGSTILVVLSIVQENEHFFIDEILGIG